MKRTAVLNVVGLDRSLIGVATPRIAQFARTHRLAAIVPAFPAVTCTAQSNYLTGKDPSAHGIVGNGWYDRDLAEVQFWKQSNHLVQSPKLWEEMRKLDSSFTCAKLFWWYNMYSSADYSITPRPMYPADGRKFFDIYTHPFSMRPEITKDLGPFPFATFWGPIAGIASPQGAADAATGWIAASARWVEDKYSPTLNLIYLPHLDYNLQRWGPGDPRILKDLAAIDEIVGNLLEFFQVRGVQVVLLSEYGITPVSRPIHLNRLFRERGWLVIKEELGRELMDCGASRVFAVADHQVAHIYLNDKSLQAEVIALLRGVEGVTGAYAGDERRGLGLNHRRAGDVVAVSAEDAWFTYYYWEDDGMAPDFARCVDIHRKPGYDPAELFLDPEKKFLRAKILFKLLTKKLGFRMLMDVVPLDASLVKGSHGARPSEGKHYPILIGEEWAMPAGDEIESTGVYQILKSHLLGNAGGRESH